MVCDQTGGAMISPNKPFEIRTNPDTWILGLRIDRRVLEGHLETLGMLSLPTPLEFTGAMDCRTGLASHLSHQIRFLADELSREESGLLQNPLALAELEHSIMTNILLGQPHNYTKYLPPSSQSACPRHVRLVEAYLEAHAQEAIAPKAFVKLTGYSLSAIYKGFQHFRGYSPMTFLKRTRLARVQANLLVASPEQTVTTIAMEWGFTHLGRLGADYNKQFGENPSDTLRRGRSGQS